MIRRLLIGTAVAAGLLLLRLFLLAMGLLVGRVLGVAPAAPPVPAGAN